MISARTKPGAQSFRVVFIYEVEFSENLVKEILAWAVLTSTLIPDNGKTFFVGLCVGEYL